MQRALNEYGYGPIKATGVYDDATRAAITRFEKDHNLPPTGQVTPRFRRELAVRHRPPARLIAAASIFDPDLRGWPAAA